MAKRKRNTLIPPVLAKAFEHYTEQVQFESYRLPLGWTENEYPVKTARTFKNSRGLAVMVGIELHEG